MKVKKVKRSVLRDRTAAQMKAAGIKGGVVLKTGAWKKAKDAGIKNTDSGRPKTTKRRGGTDAVQISDEVVMQMAIEKAGGSTTAELALRYGVSEGHVTNLIRKKYIDSRTGREVLKGILMHNGIAFAGQAAQKIEELNGMQSVVATGIMTQRWIDLDKHSATVNDSIDLDEVSRVGRLLKDLDGYVSVESAVDNDSIDIAGG